MLSFTIGLQVMGMFGLRMARIANAIGVVAFFILNVSPSFFSPVMQYVMSINTEMLILFHRNSASSSYQSTLSSHEVSAYRADLLVNILCAQTSPFLCYDSHD